MSQLSERTIVIKGAGEMASAVAWRLSMANLKKILMLEISDPLAVRRAVSFCEAVHDGRQTVEGVEAVRIFEPAGIQAAWERQQIAVAADPQWRLLEQIRPDLVVDAILAKKNLGTRTNEAALVIGLGPGFVAGCDVHMVIETNRGHDLGRIITQGAAEPNTGIPGNIAGMTAERVLRAPADGLFQSARSIGDMVSAEETVGNVAGVRVPAAVGGVIRGLIRSGTAVSKGLKIGDIDPRGRKENCYTISDKARAIGGSVLEAMMRVFN